MSTEELLKLFLSFLCDYVFDKIKYFTTPTPNLQKGPFDPLIVLKIQ